MASLPNLKQWLHVQFLHARIAHVSMALLPSAVVRPSQSERAGRISQQEAHHKVGLGETHVA